MRWIVGQAGLVRWIGGLTGSVTKLTGGVESGSRLASTAPSIWSPTCRRAKDSRWASCRTQGHRPTGTWPLAARPKLAMPAPGAWSRSDASTRPLFLSLNMIDLFGAISAAGIAANVMSLGGIQMNNTLKCAYGHRQV